MPSLVKHTPSRRELFSRENEGRLRIRSTILAVSGAASIALGMSVIVFSSKSMSKVLSETAKIRKMFGQDTTVSQLQNLISKGQQLPETILIKGVIKSSSHSKVFSIANRIDQLKPMIGKNYRPTNLFLELADVATSLKAVMQNILKLDDGKSSTAKNDRFKRRDLNMLLDNFRRSRRKAENLVVSEIFVTRLGCEAVKREHHNELGRGFGKDTTTITRRKRQTRVNVIGRHVILEKTQPMQTVTTCSNSPNSPKPSEFQLKHLLLANFSNFKPVQPVQILRTWSLGSARSFQDLLNIFSRKTVLRTNYFLVGKPFVAFKIFVYCRYAAPASCQKFSSGGQKRR